MRRSAFWVAPRRAVGLQVRPFFEFVSLGRSPAKNSYLGDHHLTEGPRSVVGTIRLQVRSDGFRGFRVGRAREPW